MPSLTPRARRLISDVALVVLIVLTVLVAVQGWWTLVVMGGLFISSALLNRFGPPLPAPRWVREHQDAASFIAIAVGIGFAVVVIAAIGE